MEATVNTPFELYTIGFTRKDAETFFAILGKAGVRRIVDVRLNNTGQLAGFTKRDDLAFFLREIGAIDYVHLPILAPTTAMLRAYRDDKSSWEVYAQQIRRLMRERKIETVMREHLRTKDCLLCSEPTAGHCHRRIVAEYLQQHWKHIDISHL